MELLELIGILTLLVTVFRLGLELGNNHKNHNDRPSSKK